MKPYRFENLPRMTRSEVNLRAALLRYLPESLPLGNFTEAVQAELQKYTNERVHLELTAVREPKFAKYRASVPDPTILFVLNASPLEKKAILQVDFGLAHILVDKVLGGTGEIPQDLRPVTPIEEGVLQFLMLKVLSFFAEANAAEGIAVQFRLDQVLTEPGRLALAAEDDDLMALLSIQLTIGKKAGFVRLALPHPLVEGLAGLVAPRDQKLTPRDLARLSSVTDLKMPLWIELGHIDVHHVDFSRLEVGDVVLIDQVFVALGENGVEGTVTVRVKEGVGGGFRGQIVSSTENHLGVEIHETF